MNVNSVFDNRKCTSVISAPPRSFILGPVGAYLKSLGLNKGKSVFGTRYNEMCADAKRTYGFGSNPAVIDMNGYGGVVMAGLTVERLDEDVKAVRTELEGSLRAVKDLVNDFLKIRDVLEPKIIEQAKSIRSARMSLTTEVTTCISTLKEIRAFMSGPEHMDEVKRIRELVVLCREVEALRASGTLEAVSELAIKMAVLRDNKGGSK